MIRLPFYFLASLIWLSASCTQQVKTEPKPISLPPAEIAALKEELKNDFRKAIREELASELKGLNTVPKDIRVQQRKAKNAALEKIILGRIEWVHIKSADMWLKARVDTGAQTSSIHAINIQEKEVDGKKYVQFESADQNNQNKVFLKRIIKTSKVRSTSGEVSRRYVVKMTIQLGHKEHEINVNLNDRNDLQYNFLIGRNLMMGQYLVDVSQSQLLGKK